MEDAGVWQWSQNWGRWREMSFLRKAPGKRREVEGNSQA